MMLNNVLALVADLSPAAQNRVARAILNEVNLELGPQATRYTVTFRHPGVKRDGLGHLVGLGIIPAIKAVRGLVPGSYGLKEAKDLVEAACRERQTLPIEFATSAEAVSAVETLAEVGCVDLSILDAS